MPVHRVGVHVHQVVLGPVVALVVVDLVAAALENVERRFVLVAVSVVGRLRRQFDEMDLDGLGEKILVARADPPPGARLFAVPRVGDLGVVDDECVVPDPLDLQLLAPELAKAVRLRGEPADEYAALLPHTVLLQ